MSAGHIDVNAPISEGENVYAKMNAADLKDRKTSHWLLQARTCAALSVSLCACAPQRAAYRRAARVLRSSCT